MHSYWEENFWISKADIAIIGSGIVGVSSAIEIKKRFPSKKIVILERGQLPTGASTKNAGFACFGSVGEILDDLKGQSENDLVETIKLRWDGLQLLKQNVPQKTMDYKNWGGTEVFTDKSNFELCESQLKYVNEIIESAIGYKNVIEIKDQSFSKGLHKISLFNPLESQLNPALMMRGLIAQALAMGIEIRNGFEVKSYEDIGKCVKINLKNNKEVTVDKVVLCTNAFTNNLNEKLDVTPARNQVFVTQPIEGLPIKGTFHYDRGYVYFRNINKRLLIGGARNISSKEETTTEFGENPIILNHLKDFVSNKLGIESFTIEKKWSGIIATGNSKKPIVEKYSQNVYLALRLGGMGVAIGSKVAREVSELLEFD